MIFGPKIRPTSPSPLRGMDKQSGGANRFVGSASRDVVELLGKTSSSDSLLAPSSELVAFVLCLCRLVGRVSLPRAVRLSSSALGFRLGGIQWPQRPLATGPHLDATPDHGPIGVPHTPQVRNIP